MRNLGARSGTEVSGTVEVIRCPGIPYTCDGFDPADWPPGEIPDFTPIRDWEARQAVVAPSDPAP